ncbi:MAG: hypothetical protein II453_03630 [Alphaproteobacteria bacterium]|nr:hypothetical protein [Alphaproteobacteria bacterium]
MDKKQVEGLLFYFEKATDVNEGIREQVIDVLNDALARIADDEAAAARKRKSPNKSGVLQLDPETYAVIAEFATQKEALAAIGQEGKSGVGDALNGRTKTHNAYGFAWCFKDEYETFLASREQ